MTRTFLSVLGLACLVLAGCSSFEKRSTAGRGPASASSPTPSDGGDVGDRPHQPTLPAVERDVLCQGGVTIESFLHTSDAEANYRVDTCVAGFKDLKAYTRGREVRGSEMTVDLVASTQGNCDVDHFRNVLKRVSLQFDPTQEGKSSFPPNHAAVFHNIFLTLSPPIVEDAISLSSEVTAMGPKNPHLIGTKGSWQSGAKRSMNGIASIRYSVTCDLSKEVVK